MSLVAVARLDELPLGALKLVAAEGRDILLVNLDGTVCAIDNTCPHNGGPLNRGRIEGGGVRCPWHQWTWDPRTGRALSPPSDWRVRRYQVVVESGVIMVGLVP